MAAESLEGWGSKIKKLREEAGLSQVALSKKIAPGFFNIVSGAETETRKFSPEEVTKFFLTIGKPMDKSIPVCSGAEVERRKDAKKRIEKQKKAAKKPSKPAKKAAHDEAPPKRKYTKKVNAPPRATQPKHPVRRLEAVIDSQPLPLSFVKQSALRDIHQIVTNPELTDSQMVSILNLFKSLTISVVLQK